MGKELAHSGGLNRRKFLRMAGLAGSGAALATVLAASNAAPAEAQEDTEGHNDYNDYDGSERVEESNHYTWAGPETTIPEISPALRRTIIGRMLLGQPLWMGLMFQDNPGVVLEAAGAGYTRMPARESDVTWVNSRNDWGKNLHGIGFFDSEEGGEYFGFIELKFGKGTELGGNITCTRFVYL